MSKAVRKAFKFREGNTFDLDALFNDYLWFAPLDALNDPYEGFARYCCEGVTDELRLRYFKIVFAEAYGPLEAERRLQELYMRQFSQDGENRFAQFVDQEAERIVQDLHEREKKKMFVCSMSVAANACERAPEPLTNMQMWSHYAGGFKGFCIEFDFDKLIGSLAAKHRSEYSGYSAIRYATDGLLPAISLKNLMEGKVNSNPDVAVTELFGTFATKHASWSYEKEVRLLANSVGKMHFDPECIRAVYLASPMPAGSKSSIRSAIAAKSKSIEVYDVHLHREKYQLGFEKVSS